MAARSDTDVHIGDLLLADDPAALSEVLATYCPEIQRVLQNRFAPELNEQDIEDALSMALSRLWFLRHEYDPQVGSLRNYFFVIAKNLAIDLLKAKTRQSSLLKKLVVRVAAEPSYATAEVKSRSNEAPGAADTEFDWKKQALAEALDEFGAVDRQILLAYAHARGQQHWAAEVAAEIGMPAGTVRVRRGRLMERLRRKMIALRENRQLNARGTSDMERSREPSPEEQPKSSRTLDDIGRDLISHREQLSYVLETIRRHTASAARLEHEQADSDSPLSFFKHLWNRAAAEGTLEKPADRAQLRGVGSWMQEIEREDEKLRTSAQSLLERVYPPPRGFRALAGRRRIDVEQVERSLMGLSQAFRRTMPEETADRGRGLFLVALDDDRGFWSGGEAQAVPLQETVTNAVSYHGKVGRADAVGALCHSIVHDLRAGDLYLPAFAWDAVHSNRHHTAYEWRLPMREPQAVEPPDDRDRYAVRTFATPPQLELNLREQYPAAADLIDEAVSVALKTHSASAHGSASGVAHEQPALDRLIEQIYTATAGEYSRTDIAGLIVPFADSHWAQADDEAVPALEQAIHFLAEMCGKDDELDRH